jgi:hypothetical protein
VNAARAVLIAVVLLPLLMLAWAAVQALWRQRVGTGDGDGDVLAGRSDCGRCACAVPCESARRGDVRQTPPVTIGRRS